MHLFSHLLNCHNIENLMVLYNIDILLFIAYVKTFFLKANVKYPTGHLQSKVVYPSRKSSCETVHLRKLA